MARQRPIAEPTAVEVLTTLRRISDRGAKDTAKRDCGGVFRYLSEAEDAMGRLWWKQRKIESRLEDGDSHYQKPKWMHWRTFNRLADKINEVERDKDRAFLISAGALFARMGLNPEEF